MVSKALMNNEFLHLPKSDQRKLLARNVPLYIQYILARYINSKTGYEQVSWLLGIHVPRLRRREKKRLKKVSLQKLNRHINLFHFSADLEYYNTLAEDLKSYNFFPDYIGK